MEFRAHIRNSSIRVRLSLITVLNCGFALLLAGVALFGYESYQQRQSAKHELAAQAHILAESTTAALSFNDEQAASQTLAGLHGDANVVEAFIYDRNNIPFSRYRKDSAQASVPPWPRPAGAYFENDALLVFAPISVGGERIGTIFLKATNDVYARLRRYIGIVFLVMVLSLLLTLLLGSATLRSLANPITALSDLSRRVSIEKDYSVRASHSTGGEIGVLVDSFNEMLSQIEARESGRRTAEESLRESEERYALAARGANDGLWDWKLTTNEIYLSPRWYQMLGYSERESWLDPDEWFSRIHPADRPAFVAEVVALRDGEERELATEYRMRHKNGTNIWVLTRGIGIRDDQGVAVRMAGSQTDITGSKIGDSLTALPNRLYFIDRLESALEASSDPAASFAVLFLDLDKFKVVNDSLGHSAGDELLRGVADRLSSAVCGSERHGFGAHSVVARLNGDEFAILLCDVGNEEGATTIAEHILETLKVPFAIRGRQVFASASIGIALSSSGKSPEDLMRNADTAMYQSKAESKDRIVVFDQHMRERAVARLETETDLRKAIETDQLTVFYQPEVSVEDQRTIGYEALVRWNHPQRGLLTPDKFIPVAEESDLIIHLGRWVLKEACRQMAEWHMSFPVHPPLTISVNVSPKQVNDPRLVNDVEAILTLTGLDPASLKLEVTESSFMANPEAALGTLSRLKQLGIGLEIDDFGTGYSSLSCLHLLPFDTVKIDRSFVKELGAGSEGCEIVRTIVELARSLTLKVVAEGVEDLHQLATLAALGCDYAQGYYFSKPKSAVSTEALLKEKHKFQQDFAMLQGFHPGPRNSLETALTVTNSKEPALV